MIQKLFKEVTEEYERSGVSIHLLEQLHDIQKLLLRELDTNIEAIKITLQNEPPNQPRISIQAPPLTQDKRITHLEGINLSIPPKTQTKQAQVYRETNEPSVPKAHTNSIPHKAVSLTTYLDLNTKMQLLNELFGGDEKRYHEALHTLSTLSTLHEAKKWLSTYAHTHHIDPDTDALTMLEALLEKQYA